MDSGKPPRQAQQSIQRLHAPIVVGLKCVCNCQEDCLYLLSPSGIDSAAAGSARKSSSYFLPAKSISLTVQLPSSCCFNATALLYSGLLNSTRRAGTVVTSFPFDRMLT